MHAPLFPLFVASSVVVAAPSSSTLNACKDISAAIPSQVSYPLSLSYYDESQEYWSVLLRDLKPACVVFPQSTEDVSKAMVILNRYPDVFFTAKSGGHDPNPGHSTVKDGVLISMRDIAGAKYDATNDVAYVKPGGEWNDVIASLAEQNVTIVGGRLGIVGVGGFLLQGGISFLSAQYGLAADNIVGWKIVAANGSILNIDIESHPDLATALKGSGSQFGIVTQFTIKAHKIGNVWGGIRIYDASKAGEIFATLHQFVPGSNRDPKAAIIITNLFAVGSIEAFLVFYFYDGEQPPSMGPFADFLKIDALIDQTSTQTYAELLKSNGAGASLLNSRISFRTLTIPYIANKPGIYSKISQKMSSLTAAYLDNPLHLASQCSVDFQPLPSIVGQHSQNNGGNAMGLTGNDGDRLILEIQCAWTLKEDDEVMRNISRELTAWLTPLIPSWLESDGMSGETYLPLFMNDAMGDQNVTGSYREYAKFKTLQLEADPEGVLRTRTGGFKY